METGAEAVEGSLWEREIERERDGNRKENEREKKTKNWPVLRNP